MSSKRPQHLVVQTGQVFQQPLQAQGLAVQPAQQVSGELRVVHGAVDQGLDGRADGTQRPPELVHQVC